MARHLIHLVVLLTALACAGHFMDAFGTWNDDVSTAVSAARLNPPPRPVADEGFARIDCFRCPALPRADAFALGALVLLIAGGPLAFAAAVLERRQHQFGGAAVPPAWCQAGAIAQAASVALGALFLCLIAGNPYRAGTAMTWRTSVSVADIVFGVPALFTWRHLLAAAFAVPHRVLALRRR